MWRHLNWSVGNGMWIWGGGNGYKRGRGSRFLEIIISKNNLSWIPTPFHTLFFRSIFLVSTVPTLTFLYHLHHPSSRFIHIHHHQLPFISLPYTIYISYNIVAMAPIPISLDPNMSLFPDELTESHIPHQATDSPIPHEVTDKLTDSQPFDPTGKHEIDAGASKKHHGKGQRKKHHGKHHRHGAKKGVQIRGWSTGQAAAVGLNGGAVMLLNGHSGGGKQVPKGYTIAGLVVAGVALLGVGLIILAGICLCIWRALHFLFGARQERSSRRWYQAPATSTAATTNPQPGSVEGQMLADVDGEGNGSSRWWNRLAAVAKRPRTKKQFESFHMFDVLTISKRSDNLDTSGV